MAFTLISTTDCDRGEKTVIQSGSTGGFTFFVRTFNLSTTDNRLWAWCYNFWDTGNADIARAIKKEAAFWNDRHMFETTAVPEGTQGLMIYVPKSAALDSYSVALYRRL